MMVQDFAGETLEIFNYYAKIIPALSIKKFSSSFSGEG